MSAAGVNGALTSLAANEALENGLAAKRKREDESAEPAVANVTSRSAQVQKDVLQVLSTFDTEPSFLKRSLDGEERVASDDEPTQKKAKLSSQSTPNTIASKLEAGAYSSIARLKEDASRIGESFVSSLRSAADEKNAQNGRVQPDELKQIHRVMAFEQLVKDVADRESRHEASHAQTAVPVKPQQPVQASGHISNEQTVPQTLSSTVLTLFGNAPTPKQLFSSLQQAGGDQRHATLRAELPVEEMSLPNGLAATKVLSVPADDGNKAEPTFADSFATPSTLPQLQPPKPLKRSSVRGGHITWEFKEPLSRPSKKGPFTVQPLNTGDWLSYGGSDFAGDSASSLQRLRQRDRALSGGLPAPSFNKQNPEVSPEKEEEALFKRAYSSFAPSCDNTSALVSDEVKSMVWWQKVGAKRYNERFALDPELLDQQKSMMDEDLPPVDEPVVKDEEIDRAMQDLDSIEGLTVEPALPPSETDINETLRNISDLLETLAAHQRIRNANQPSSAATRTPASPALASMDMIVGRPDAPAVYETETYNTLKRKLASLILELPPYAVAKVAGDQLAELGVSTLLTSNGTDIKGTMEEDQVSRQAKYAAMTAASGIASLQRSASAASPHYSSSNQRAPAIGQAANTRYGQISQGQRTPASTYQRPSGGQSIYGTPNTTSRPSYSQPNQLPRQPSHGQLNPQYQPRAQTGTGLYGNYGQQNTTTPSAQYRPNYPSSQPLAQYQQRSQAAATNVVSNHQSNSNYQLQRNPSPAKPAGLSAAGQNTPGPTSRPSYATQQYPGQQYAQQQQANSGRATPSYPSNPHTPVNGYQQPPPPPVAPRATSDTPQPPLSLPGQNQAQGQVNGHAPHPVTSYDSGSGFTPGPLATGGTIHNFNSDDASPKHKRNRRPVACDNCRLRKHKCVIDGDAPPCRNCAMNARSCTFGESTDILRASSTAGGGVGSDGKKKLRCDLCKEKKMACAWDTEPPCVSCKMRGLRCTFDVAEAKLRSQGGSIGVSGGGMKIDDADLPYKPENMSVGMRDD